MFPLFLFCSSMQSLSVEYFARHFEAAEVVTEMEVSHLIDISFHWSMLLDFKESSE